MGNALAFLHGHCCEPSACGESDRRPPNSPPPLWVPPAPAPAPVPVPVPPPAPPPNSSAPAPCSCSPHPRPGRGFRSRSPTTLPPPHPAPSPHTPVPVPVPVHAPAPPPTLPPPHPAPAPHTPVPVVVPAHRYISASHQEVEQVLYTLPVEARDVGDGDGIKVYVSTSDPRESSLVPFDVQIMAVERSDTRSSQAKELDQEIVKKGYRFITVQNEKVLARMYRIRLRGIDAPEIGMPYGKEAKEELAKMVRGKRLTVRVYNIDQYGRSVGDVYCDGIFVQELMLKRGMVWHYKAYDQRAEFAEWEENARAERKGLWASPNPKKPWEWRRKNRRRGRQRLPKSDYPTFCHSWEM